MRTLALTWSEVYSEPSQISKMKRFVKMVNGFQPFTIFAKRSILDLRLGFEYAFYGSLFLPVLTYVRVLMNAPPPTPVPPRSDCNNGKSFV